MSSSAGGDATPQAYEWHALRVARIGLVGSVPLGFVCALLFPVPYGTFAFLALPVFAVVSVVRVRFPRCAAPFVATPFALLAERCAACGLLAFARVAASPEVDRRAVTITTGARLVRDQRILRAVAAWHVGAATLLLLFAGLPPHVVRRHVGMELVLVGIVGALALVSALLVWRGSPWGRPGVAALQSMQAVAFAVPGVGWRVQLGPFAGPWASRKAISLEAGVRIGVGLPTSPAPEGQLDLLAPGLLAVVLHMPRNASA